MSEDSIFATTMKGSLLYSHTAKSFEEDKCNEGSPLTPHKYCYHCPNTGSKTNAPSRLEKKNVQQ